MRAKVFPAFESNIPAHRVSLGSDCVGSPMASDNAAIWRDLAAGVASNLTVNHSRPRVETVA
jgi:hypothetical protein